MEAEQIEIAGFLRQYPPFSELPEEAVDSIAMQIEISYYRAGTDVYRFGDEIRDLCVIRSGAVEIYRRNGNLYNRLSEGDLFGQLGLLMGNKVRLPARAMEDSLIYFVPEDPNDKSQIISATYNYKNGSLHGEFKEFFMNGVVKKKGQ